MKLPGALLHSLQNVAGFQEQAFVQAHETPQQVTSIRINPAKVNMYQQFFNAATRISNAGSISAVPWCTTGHYLETRPSFILDPYFHAGCYYVQEASSMFIEQAVKQVFPDHAARPYRILDLCAAPGGKSTHLASLFPQGLVVCNEVIKTRAGILAENAIKWGTPNIIVTSADSADFKKLPGFFDMVLVDAPCSGSGMFRKDPDAITEWSPGNVLHCSKRQQRILEDVWPCLKENGLLLYSTCSYSTEENESIADWLGNVFNVQGVSIPVNTEWGIVETLSPLLKLNGYRFYPDQTRGEGYFMCPLIKTSSAEEGNYRLKKLPTVSRADEAFYNIHIKSSQPVQYLTHAEEIIAFPEEWLDALAIISSLIYVKKAGIKTGKIMNRELVPDHELAVSTLIINAFEQIELNYENALQYLRKQDINIQPSFKGWGLVTYGGFRVGWLKALPNRINNYYPQRFRILKH